MNERSINASADGIFKVLRAVAHHDAPVGATEISQRTGLPVGRVQRAIVTLEAAGYLARSEYSAKFSLTATPQSLALSGIRRFKIREPSLPYLRRLASDSKGIATLDVTVGWFGIRIATAYSGIHSHSALGAPVGEAKKLHLSVTGQLMLAFRSDHSRFKYYEFLRLPSHKIEELENLRMKICDQGYYTQSLPSLPNGSLLALPLKYSQGATIAAIGLSVLDSGNLTDILEQGRRIIADLQRVLAANISTDDEPYAHLDPNLVEIGDT